MTQEGRNTTCNVLVGAQRTGKTSFAKTIADLYPKKVLVVCPDDMESKWWKYKRITTAEIPALEKGRYRLIYDPRDKMFLPSITDSFTNGMLILDDSKVYFNTNKKIFDLEVMLVRRRQANFDVMFMYHGFSAIPPLLWTYATHLTLFNTIDASQRAKGKTPQWEMMMEALANVKREAEKNPYYNEIISLLPTF